MNEPIFKSGGARRQSKLFWVAAPRVQGWSVRSILMSPLHALHSAFASSGDPETQP